MSDKFRVCVRRNLCAALNKLFTNIQIVLDDTVMNKVDPTYLVRMGIALRRFPVSRPTSMTNTDVTIELFSRKLLFESF
ncbi:hypothetical protein D3C87_1903420 [compost metagenome]